MLLFLSAPLIAGDIVNVHTSDNAGKSRVVIDFNGDVNFQAKIDHQILIIHLPKKIFKRDLKLTSPFQTITSKIIDDRFLKLSIPLSSSHKIKSAFVIKGTPHRLVVDLMKGKSDDIIHGPLVIDKPKTAKVRRTQKPVIMIDPGHGGHDSGAVGTNNIREKDIVLSIAKIFAKKLNESGRYTAKLTRKTDHFIPLYDRVDIAQKAKADLFISIHADSLRGEQAQGASIYTLSKDASDAQTALLVARENNTNNTNYINTDTNINKILVDMAMKDTAIKSKKLAKTIIQQLKQTYISTVTSPHRHGGFVVLKSPEIPSVLFETGFISDEKQAEKLVDPLYQMKISNSLLLALDDYFGL